MTTTPLPPLAAGVKFLGPDGRIVENKTKDGGQEFPTLWALYRVHGLKVSIGWVVGHPMGSFREPNKLTVDFDSFDHAMGYDRTEGETETKAFEGITTSLLRSIPMAHALALMRDRYEQLSLADIRSVLDPLPSRVETDYDYLYVASAFVALAEVSVEPVRRLAEWSGESVETWSARLRRARARGILTGKGRQSSIAPNFIAGSHEIWAEMRARKAKNGN